MTEIDCQNLISWPNVYRALFEKVFETPNKTKTFFREWITPAVATWILDKLVRDLNNTGKFITFLWTHRQKGNQFSRYDGRNRSVRRLVHYAGIKS